MEGSSSTASSSCVRPSRQVVTRKRILFVRGFNTDNIRTNDAYSHVREVLSQKHTVEYFGYNPNDDIEDVYQRLCETIRANRSDGPTHLIGHSMGGGLLMRWVKDHYTTKQTKYRQIEKVVLLMPLVYKVGILESLCQITLAGRLFVPKALILPASQTFTDGNLLNDDFSLLPVKQIVGMYRRYMLDSTDLVDTLNHHSDKVVLFYAKEEAFNVIPTEILDEIDHVVYVDGLHESFNGRNTSRAFFKALLRHISK